MTAPRFYRDTDHQYPLRTPPVPAAGKIMWGCQALTPAGDLPTFYSNLGISSIALWSAFTSNNGSLAGPLADADRAQAMACVAWGFPGTIDLAHVATGTDDAYITAQANLIRNFGRPVYLRMNWEMQGAGFYPWQAYDSSNNPRAGYAPTDYVAAWRRVYTMVKAIAPNAVFVWCPHLWVLNTAGVTPDTWYPGDAYVDWCAMNAYPGAANYDYLINGAWGVKDMLAFAVAHGKPQMVCETAMDSGTGDNATLFGNFLTYIEGGTVPSNVQAIMWFQFNNTGVNGQNYLTSQFPNCAAILASRFSATGSRYLTRPPIAMNGT